MFHHWLLLTFSWFGTVSLQYISSEVPSNEGNVDTVESIQETPLPYATYFNLASGKNNYDPLQNAPDNEQYYERENVQSDLLRKRRMTDTNDEKGLRWLPNLVDTDRTMYLENNNNQDGSPFVVGISNPDEHNITQIFESMAKRYFSPWGGKRGKGNVEHAWTWKRAANIREPSMPKRVRFSPWGGKRSGQMIYKPGKKGSKTIYATSIPELMRIVPNLNRFNFAGIQFIPAADKRHPIRILALSTRTNDRTLRDALPFKSFLDSLPKLYKPGHPYIDVHLKKDGKRKVKFSAWGGKRSPPIIGPIWTPAPQDVKESTLNAILLIRDNQDYTTTKAL